MILWFNYFSSLNYIGRCGDGAGRTIRLNVAFLIHMLIQNEMQRFYQATEHHETMQMEDTE